MTQPFDNRDYDAAEIQRLEDEAVVLRRRIMDLESMNQEYIQKIPQGEGGLGLMGGSTLPSFQTALSLAGQDEGDQLLVLRRRIMDLEGCLVHVRNYLPAPLKAHAEEVLWGSQ